MTEDHEHTIHDIDGQAAEAHETERPEQAEGDGQGGKAMISSMGIEREVLDLMMPTARAV